jgi:hypothetical protein
MMRANNMPKEGINKRAYSSTLLAICGVILIGIGLYFIFVRPAFLPEDARFAGASLKELQTVAPNIAQWLGRVFWVLGGYITATGILTLYAARTSFKARARGASIVVAFAGAASIGLMAVVNILIGSDFKWPLVGIAALWTLAVILHGKGK